MITFNKTEKNKIDLYLFKQKGKQHFTIKKKNEKK